MTLFGAVAPVSSDKVLEIGRQQLGVTASGELFWDMIRVVKSHSEAQPVLLKRCVASWLLFCNASHSLALSTS